MNGVTFTLGNGTAADDITELNGVVDDPLPESELTVLPVTLLSRDVLVFDILSFGETDDGVENNAIYRHLLEETDAGGVFEGTLEYIMLNQVNIGRRSDTYAA